MSKMYDIVIIGAGPAGLAAGLYAGRAKMSTLIIEKAKDDRTKQQKKRGAVLLSVKYFLNGFAISYQPTAIS